MKITLFTSNQNRHNSLINLISENCDELFVIQECKSVFPGIVPGQYPTNELMKKYFKKVKNAEEKFFSQSSIYSNLNKKINILPIIYGDLSKFSIEKLSLFLNSDIYIVFGSSYIKGDLINFLIKKKTINIHMGISPYYRGTDCNFWALYDNNPDLVGASIHMLSSGLDSGDILYHAISTLKDDPFNYTMSTVLAAFKSIIVRLKDKTLFKIKPQPQNKKLEIRYSRKDDFNENVVKKFLEKDIDLKKKEFNLSKFKDPYVLKYDEKY